MSVIPESFVPSSTSSKKVNTSNIYTELAQLDPKLADRIMNAKTSGGRNLNAIWECGNIDSSENIILVFLGGQMNFCEDFADQYRFISLNTIAEKTKFTRQAVIKILRRLIEKGYVHKKEATVEDQKKGWANHYCITSKIFDEYIMQMITAEKKDESGLPLVPDRHPPCKPGLHPPVNDVYSPCKPGLHKDPVLDPSFQTPSMCGKEKSPHTQKEEKQIDPPKALQWMLSDALRLAFPGRRHFIANEECAEIISAVVKKTGCSLKQFREMLRGFSKVEPYDVFNSQYFDFERVINDLADWITRSPENSAASLEMNPQGFC